MEEELNTNERDRSSPLPPETSSSDEETEEPTLMKGTSSSDEKTEEPTRFGILYDIDILNCPVCFQGFIGYIFQCDNGHLACFDCCHNLRNICPYCTLPIGTIRSRVMEKMVESIIVHCQNLKFGCKEILSSRDRRSHEEECVFLQCYCPLSNCDYKGRYKDLFQHFDATHNNDESWFGRNLYNKPFRFGESFVISMHIWEKMCVLMETNDSLLFIVHCFEKTDSICVSVECIAPSEVREFSCSISFGYGEVKLKSELLKTKKSKEVIFENPKVDFMFSSYFMENGKFKFKVVINKNM